MILFHPLRVHGWNLFPTKSHGKLPGNGLPRTCLFCKMHFVGSDTINSSCRLQCFIYPHLHVYAPRMSSGYEEKLKVIFSTKQCDEFKVASLLPPFFWFSCSTESGKTDIQAMDKIREEQLILK